MSVFVLTFIVSCSGDDSDEPQSGFHVPSETVKRIDEMFGSQRLDSISFGDYEIKLRYEGRYLTSYKEFYEKELHDGVSFSLVWDKDTVRIKSSYRTYRAAIGSNGLVEKLYCPSGKVNTYTYDSDNQLIEYDVELVDIDDNQRMELKWTDGNVVEAKEIFSDGDYEMYYYTYGNDDNTAALLPPCRRNCWITDAGLSWGNDINIALYYAGLLGKGTANLPIVSRSKWSSGQSGRLCEFEYEIDDDGLVKSVFDSYWVKYDGKELYFYK